MLDDVKFELKKIETIDNLHEKYDVSVKVPLALGWIERMSFIVEDNQRRILFNMHHTNNTSEYACFETQVVLDTSALYHYYFSLVANNNYMYYKKKNNDKPNQIVPDDMWKLSVNFEVPDWAKGKIMYHIFVDRFNRSNNDLLKEMPHRTIHTSWDEDVVVGPNEEGIWNADFYGGNLQGIIDKLDYIKSLGVSIIYLSPIVWSQSNHRYDAADYENVDPYLGTNKDLKELCDKAHELGIKIVLDAVFNHTGNDSKYFNQYGHFDNLGAYQSNESEYYDFYRKYIHNNQTFFDYWWGMKNLPVCDGNSKKWQDYIYGEGGIIDLWFDLGIDGLRLDVADELSDEFIEGIRSAVKRNKPDGFILGEVWKNPMRMNRSYISSGKGMDTVMNYTLVDALIRYIKYRDVNKLRDVIYQLKTEYPDDTLNSLMNFTSTHDISRAINIFGTREFQYNGEWAWNLSNNNIYWQKDYKLSPENYELGKDIYKAYLYTLTYLPGILSIFYGDEAGLQGMGNLSNRRPFHWDNIDKDLLEFVRNIGKIRNTEKFLETADLDIIDINDKYFMFTRSKEDEQVLFTMNRSSSKSNLYIPEKYRDYKIIHSHKDTNKEEIDSHGVLVLKK